MRDFKGMKRQRGRNRGGGGGGGGGGKPQQQNANRAFDSNGPEGVKVRGNAQHVFEKYQQLARDATTGGDRVLGENYLQHAEHYFRLLRAMQPQRPASEILGRDQFSSGFDIDFEDEGAQAQAAAADEAAAEAGESQQVQSPAEGDGRDRNGWQARDDRPREDRPREDRQRDDRPRDDRPRGDRQEGRRDRWRDERPRDDRPRDDRPRDERPRDERPREDRVRDERPRDERPRDRQDRREREPVAMAEPAADLRPSPMLRDAEGGESHAPAFLQTRAEPRPEVAEDEGAPKPRRRRAPRSFAGDAPKADES